LPIKNNSCCVLIATLGRYDYISKRALPSIKKQSLKPEAIVIICDGKPFSAENCSTIQKTIPDIPIFFQLNQRTPGVSGAWNSGLKFIRDNLQSEFVAILDDDDTWDHNHLQKCLQCALQNNANVVISGLRMIKDEILIDRPHITSLQVRDFLIGNPGWQGSNTFIKLGHLSSVGNFREELTSLNDRDLAIRVLRHPMSQIAFTCSWTASWFLETDRKQLSSPKSKNKIKGLKFFWSIYSKEMTYETQNQFFSRADQLFGVNKKEIVKHD